MINCKSLTVFGTWAPGWRLFSCPRLRIAETWSFVAIPKTCHCYLGAIFVNSSRSCVTHWTTWLHSRVFNRETKVIRAARALPRLSLNCVCSRSPPLRSSRLALVPLPPPTAATTSTHCSLSLSFSPFPPTYIGSSLSHELAAFRQAPRACDDSLHSDCTHCRTSISTLHPLRTCTLTICVGGYSDCTRYVYHIYALPVRMEMFVHFMWYRFCNLF